MSNGRPTQCGRCSQRLTPRGGLAPRFCPRCGSALGAQPSPPAPPTHQFIAQSNDAPGTAIAALIFGILGFIPTCFPAGPVAIILGASARGKIAASSGRMGGKGLATAGMVLGIIACSMWTMVCAGAAL